MSKDTLPDWEELLSAASRLQGILPGAVLVGGTAAAIHAQHRRSQDADHVIPDLTTRFEEVLGLLESVAGWETARIKRPVLILGSLDGIETGIRQLIRKQPLEIEKKEHEGHLVVVPTAEEILRIKAALILQRNATRDYVDLVALLDFLGKAKAAAAFCNFDACYPQPHGESALQQLQIQLANALPYDLEGQNLAEYKNLAPRWHNWETIANVCREFSVDLLCHKR